MEVDSVHSAIERKLKKKQIYSSAGFVTVIEEARIRTRSNTLITSLFLIFLPRIIDQVYVQAAELGIPTYLTSWR